MTHEEIMRATAPRTARFTVRTVDTANALLLAGAKADTLLTALALVNGPLPEGTTREVIEAAIRQLTDVSASLTHEGNTLNRLGDSS